MVRNTTARANKGMFLGRLGFELPFLFWLIHFFSFKAKKDALTKEILNQKQREEEAQVLHCNPNLRGQF